MDINVTSVWNRNITGRTVTVAIVDDGVEWTNQDIRDNYSKEGSWDLNDHDPDPMPSNKKGFCYLRIIFFLFSLGKINVAGNT